MDNKLRYVNVAAQNKERGDIMIKDILKLGNPQLYVVCTEYNKENIKEIEEVVHDLHDTMMEYKRVYGAGRAIAAPQIGVQKRLLYMYVDKPVVFINPVLHFPGDEKMIVMDDCMSFPGLLVKVERYHECEIEYFDMEWKRKKMQLSGDLAELIQHEYDHLDGILATMRAIDRKSFFYGDINDYR